jgi:hypothetical protein
MVYKRNIIKKTFEFSSNPPPPTWVFVLPFGIHLSPTTKMFNNNS